MSERRIYICDICKKESEEAMPSGMVYSQIMVGNLCYSSESVQLQHLKHTCHACLDIISREIKAKFNETVLKLMQGLTVSKLMKDLMG